MCFNIERDYRSCNSERRHRCSRHKWSDRGLCHQSDALGARYKRLLRAGSSNGLSLYASTPCRVLDSRNPPGAPPWTGQRAIAAVASGCSLPQSAQEFVANITVLPFGPLGFVTVWPDGTERPLVSTLNSIDGSVMSNMAIIQTLNGSVDAYTSSAAHLIFDVSGISRPDSRIRNAGPRFGRYAGSFMASDETVQDLRARVDALERSLREAQASNIRLLAHLALVDKRLLGIERNRVFRLWGAVWRRVIAMRNGRRPPGSGSRDTAYRQWIAQVESPAWAGFTSTPRAPALISVLTRDVETVRSTLEQQTYTNWEVRRTSLPPPESMSSF